MSKDLYAAANYLGRSSRSFAFRTRLKRKANPNRALLRKGRAFEEFVATLFPAQNCRLLNWRGDCSLNGVLAESGMCPDFEIELGSSLFILECKFRSAWSESAAHGLSIRWCKRGQRERYTHYAQEKGGNFYLLLGVGGKPEAPDKVYVIPQAELRSDELAQTQIERYLGKLTTNGAGQFSLNNQGKLLLERKGTETSRKPVGL